MNKITSPLQALGQIRALCVPSPLTYEQLRIQVEVAALAGLTHAVPLSAPTRKATRDLVAGDVLVFDDKGRRVVILARPSSSPNHISVSSVELGAYNEDGIRINHFPLDSQFIVEAPAGLTPVQAAADRLLDSARTLLKQVAEAPVGQRIDFGDLRTLLDELDPPKPPTLEEALEVLREFAGSVGVQVPTDSSYGRARKLLARVPKE